MTNQPYIHDSKETEARKKVVLADYYAAFPQEFRGYGKFNLGDGDE